MQQVDGLLGRSVKLAGADQPLVAHMQALFLTAKTWSIYRPLVHVAVR